MKIGGIILAAGKSSRMGNFKPLLPFKGKTIIENTVLSLLLGGADNIVVVTGRNAQQVEEVLKDYNVRSVRNADYENTHMLDSILLGLKELMDTDAVFILPGDIPDVKPETVRQLKEVFIKGNYDVIYPCFKGRKGHPPLIRNTCFKAISKYEGSGGLRGILSFFEDNSVLVETEDSGSITDIDYKEDYKKLLHKYGETFYENDYP